MTTKPQKQKIRKYYLKEDKPKRRVYKKPQTEAQRVYQEGRY